jgi:hypothetical protein
VQQVQQRSNNTKCCNQNYGRDHHHVHAEQRSRHLSARTPLLKPHFRLHHLKYRHTGPVIASADTRAITSDGTNITNLCISVFRMPINTWQRASERGFCAKVRTLCRGGIVEASNAEVASWLMRVWCSWLMVVSEILFGELSLNRAFVLNHGVEIADCESSTR